MKARRTMRISTIPLTLGLMLALGSATLQAQPWMSKPSAQEIATLPAWAQMMYAQDPVVWSVDSAFAAHHRSHPFEKSYHTQYYKRWRRAAEAHLQPDGRIAWPSLAEREAQHQQVLRKHGDRDLRGGGWSVLGPLRMYNGNGDPETNQTNVFSLAQCAGTPSVMYAGTEPGEVYRSADGGNTWTSITAGTPVDGGVTAVAVSPSNPDLVLAGAGWYITRSTNGGATWATALNANSLYPAEISFHPSNHSIALAATNAGLYRSTDAGATWTQIHNEAHWDIQWKPGNPNTVYTVRRNSSLVRQEFYRSTDAGLTWTLRDNGWYSSSDPARNVEGARLAVTPADSNRVYAYLIGQAKANDVGFIGLYRSTDGGDTWTLPNGPDGGPYSSSHPNLAQGTPTWNYHQGFYNCALMASSTNADHVLIGGLNLWRSDDGGTTFSSVSGYVGGPLDMHVDNQDFRVFGNAYWISTDGGIYKSTDFFNTQPSVQMDGIHGSDYWGFGSGWNEDVLVGGLYHNGNNAWHENYGQGNHLSLGGGEAPTGYVNPGNNRRTYFSDIGGRIIPGSIGQPISGAAFGLSPNETYFGAESSEMEWHPNSYNTVFLGRDHKLWRSDDGGGAFTLVDSFGNNTNSKIHYIEISRSNPNVMYISQQPASGNAGQLWKTTDGGANWASMPLPAAPNKRKILIALHPEDHNTVFIAFPQAGNGNKVYRSTDGGATWTNLSTAMLDDESIQSIVLVGGTPNSLYACTDQSIYYRDDNLGAWITYDAGLPLQFNSNIARAFYRDGKIRVASYGKGLWTNDLHTPQSRPIATPSVDKFSTVCDADSFYFECHSMLRHAGATWAWTFQGGSPATSSLRNPVVQFSGVGQHLVTLTVTDGNNQSDTDSLYITLSGISATSITADFEAQFPPADWRSAASGNLSWVQDNNVGGYGASTASAAVDNFSVDGIGTWTDLRAYVNLDTVQDATLTFDVAYAEYGGQYTDTLEVLASTDCGQTFTQLYRKGGQGLATAPNFTASAFVPTSSQWRTDTVDLGAYQGQAQVVVAFRCIGHWGQVMYLDNVNLAGTPVVGLELEDARPWAQLAPNPVLAGQPLRLRSNAGAPLHVRLMDLHGRVVRQAWMRDGELLPTQGLGAATYLWEASGDGLLQRGRAVILQGAR